ncbi:hypothetical protein D3C73_1353230 [compost metagenome]
MIQRRVRQLQQPLARCGVGRGQVAQIDLEPEHRSRIAGIQHLFTVQAKTLGEGGRGNLGDAGAALAVFIDLHGAAQRKVPGGVVEIDRSGQHGQAAQKQNQQIAHTAPAWRARTRRNGPLSL